MPNFIFLWTYPPIYDHQNNSGPCTFSPNRQRVPPVLTTSAESTVSKANLLVSHFSSPCLISQLQPVQRFAARLVTKRWSSPPDQLIHSLYWSTLQTRRKNKRWWSTDAPSQATLSYHTPFLPLTQILIQDAITPTLSPLLLLEFPYINHLFY